MGLTLPTRIQSPALSRPLLHRVGIQLQRCQLHELHQACGAAVELCLRAAEQSRAEQLSWRWTETLLACLLPDETHPFESGVSAAQAERIHDRCIYVIDRADS